MKLGPFLGENNRRQRHALSAGEKGSFIAGSSNIVIDDTGRVETRGATELAAPLSSGRSLFSAAGKMLFVDGATLYRVTDMATLTTAVTGSVGSGHVSFAESNGEIFYSDETQISCLQADNTTRLVGVPTPVSMGLVAISGALDPAWYQVTVSYLVGSEEGGAYPAQNIELTGVGGIRVVLPAAPVAATRTLVYLSGPNGEVPFLHSDHAPATTTIDLTSKAQGRSCLTQYKAPLPAGHLLAFLQGRLFSAVGGTVHYSDPYNYGLTTPSKNYIQFPAHVSVMAPCVNGMFIVADQTYWLTGVGTEQQNLQPVLPYGAVRFSQGEVRNEKKVFWLSQRGVVIGDSQGQVANIQEDALLLDLSGDGAALHVEGVNRIVATNG